MRTKARLPGKTRWLARVSAMTAGIFLAGIFLVGCTNTYLETKTKVRSGVYDRELQKAEQDYQNEKDRQVQIERDQARVADEQLSLKRDIDRVQSDLATLNKELAQSAKDLEKARAENKLTREEYEDLKRQLDQLRFEQQIQQNSGAAPAERQAELTALQQRKAALQKAIELLAGS